MKRDHCLGATQPLAFTLPTLGFLAKPFMISDSVYLSPFTQNRANHPNPQDCLAICFGWSTIWWRRRLHTSIFWRLVRRRIPIAAARSSGTSEAILGRLILVHNRANFEHSGLPMPCSLLGKYLDSWLMATEDKAPERNGPPLVGHKALKTSSH
jgi:hypothetical protein